MILFRKVEKAVRRLVGRGLATYALEEVFDPKRATVCVANGTLHDDLVQLFVDLLKIGSYLLGVVEGERLVS